MQTDGGKRASDFLVLSEATEARIDGYLMERLIAFLSAELPAISAMLNVERLVVTQVKTLDVVEVERIILKVAGRHPQVDQLFRRWSGWSDRPDSSGSATLGMRG